jgi:hypothetical protein
MHACLPCAELSGVVFFLGYAVENIKRLELYTRLENGLVGLKGAKSDDEKVSESS